MNNQAYLANAPGNTVCPHCNLWTRKGAKCFDCGKVLFTEKEIPLEVVREAGPEVERGDETGG